MGREIIYRGEEIREEERVWRHLGEGERPEEGEAVVVPLERFLNESADLRSVAGALCVLLDGGDDPARLAGSFELLDSIAVAFPRFGDGRGYSIARLLRDRHGWRGELRAVGQILQDQLFYLHRCGFDVLELQQGKSAVAALDAFKEFSVVYQPASDDRAPVYARARPWPHDTSEA